MLLRFRLCAGKAIAYTAGMKSLCAMLLILLATAMPCHSYDWRGRCIGVVDGDTVIVYKPGRRAAVWIRLYGIDCPEKDQPCGDLASSFVSEKILGKTVLVSQAYSDCYGRSVANIVVDGENLAEELLRAGLAWVFDPYCGSSDCAAWREIEADARGKRAVFGLKQNLRRPGGTGGKRLKMSACFVRRNAWPPYHMDAKGNDMENKPTAEAAALLAESGLGFTSSAPKPGNSQYLARTYLDSICLEMRTIDAVAANAGFELFGHKLATPIMAAALSSLDRLRPQGMLELAAGVKRAGSCMWAGVGGESELEAIIASGVDTIKIIKPYRDHDLIFRKIAHAEQAGALAVGMDISFAFGMKNSYMPAPMSPKTTRELAEFAKSSKLPFIVKGVLSVRDAEKAVEAGASAIVVSHQGGTVLDYAVPPLKILPDIVESVFGKTLVFAEGAIASGIDAFKALALGADGVCVGHALLTSLAAAGADGVAKTLQDMTAELTRTLSLTGCKGLDDIDSQTLVF